MHSMCCAVLFAMLLGSCSTTSADGDWEPMKWEAQHRAKVEKGVYMVGAACDTLRFSCSNYKGPWMSSAVEDGVELYPDVQNGNYRDIRGSHFSASITGNELAVAFAENQSADAHSVTLTVTAGDIFYTFRFLQAAPSNKDNSD